MDQIVKEEVPPVETDTKANPDNVVVLGKRKNNPYTVENMKRAFSEVSSRARLADNASAVKTSHLYIRILPKDWAEYDALEADTNLTLYNIPLDYEILKQGSIYHEPSIPADKPTWQYTTIPVGYVLPNGIKYELISECYIPELDKTMTQISASARLSANGKSFTDVLLDKAMVLSDNEGDTLKVPTGNARVAWQPRGRVMCLDTRLNQMIGLQGVKITVRRWIFVKIRDAVTDADERYSFEDFNRPVNYSCVFETDKFDIRSGTWGQVKFDGPKSSSPWDLNFWANDLNRFYCDVFRGAFAYNNGDNGGLKRPFTLEKIKYAALDKQPNKGAQGVNIGNWNLFSINPNILIYRFSNSGAYESDEVFSTTCHETCHTTHWEQMNAGWVQFSQVCTFISESWPVAVEWYLTSIEYRKRGIANYGAPDYINLTNRWLADGTQEPASYPLNRGWQR